MKCGIALTIALLAGCQSGSSLEPLDGDEFDDRSHGGRTLIVGDIAFGETSERFEAGERGQYPYRALEFTASEGSEAQVWVMTASNGDPVVWVVDDTLRTIGFNLDADLYDPGAPDDTTKDALLNVKLEGSVSDTYYIIVTDQNLEKNTFYVWLEGCEPGSTLSEEDGSCVPEDGDSEEDCSGTTVFCGPENPYWSVEECRCVDTQPQP